MHVLTRLLEHLFFGSVRFKVAIETMVAAANELHVRLLCRNDTTSPARRRSIDDDVGLGVVVVLVRLFSDMWQSARLHQRLEPRAHRLGPADAELAGDLGNLA